MVERHRGAIKAGWICLGVVSLGILGFGVVTALVPAGRDRLLVRADGLASVGMGLFGTLLVLMPLRRRERWAWWALWFYPLFWTVHLVDGLPPGKDHVHQVLFLVLSLAGLMATFRGLFRRRDDAHAV